MAKSHPQALQCHPLGSTAVSTCSNRKSQLGTWKTMKLKVKNTRIKEGQLWLAAIWKFCIATMKIWGAGKLSIFSNLSTVFAFDNLSKNMARICVCRLQLTEAEVADPESDEFSFSFLCLATKRFTPMKHDWLESQIVKNLVTATWFLPSCSHWPNHQ